MHSDMSYPYITYTYTCKGETFDVPEVVPFRLTQNMVHAMVCLHAHTHTHTHTHKSTHNSASKHMDASVFCEHSSLNTVKTRGGKN